PPELDEGLDQRLLELRCVQVIEANGQLCTRIGEVSEEDRSISFVAKKFGPQVVRQGLDPQYGAMLLTAAVLGGLLEEPRQLVETPALPRVERAHQDEHERRALNLRPQGLSERLSRDELAVIEEDADLRLRRCSFHIKYGCKQVLQVSRDVSAPVAD